MPRLCPAAPEPDPLQHQPEPVTPWQGSGRRAGEGMAHVAADDWDHLFAAVNARLGECLAKPPSADLRSTVSDCLHSLALLQALRERQRSGDRRLEGELRRSSGALAAARIELVEARLGERRARHLAQHDSLTALPNRSHFSERLDQALRGDDEHPPTLAVLFLDLDGFKPINDRHGHDAGDTLLRIVAERLSRSVRSQDMVCRLGGDEFACMLNAPRDREHLSQLATKLFAAVSAPLTVGGVQISVKPSIGIAVCPSDGDTSATLLKRADSAMYRAKRRQLGFAFFDRRADS